MIERNSTNDVFRFVQLRPPAAVDPTETVPLDSGTAFAKKILAAPSSRRRVLAQGLLSSAASSIASLRTNKTSAQLLEAFDAGIEADETIRQLQETVSRFPNWNAVAKAAQLSDYLLAVRLASVGTTSGLLELTKLFRVASTGVSVSPATRDRPLREYVRWPIVWSPGHDASATPTDTGTRRAEVARRDVPADERSSPEWPVRVHRALKDLWEAHCADVLNSPVAARAAPSPARQVARRFSPLARIGSNLLSDESRKVLRIMGVDPARSTLVGVTTALESELASPPALAPPISPHVTPLLPGPSSAPSELASPTVRPCGVADLLVVKQHLKAYRRMDIAHVENVLIGEIKQRVHRSFERSEETFISEREQTRERELELETAERFELQQETEKTIQRDQKIGFGLTVSGKYGPSVEFSSNLQADVSVATQESTRNAVTYAKDVMQRSLERVTERVREEQIRKLTRELEETNTHTLDNKTNDHVVGMYQFLEKVYECQVFNYGIREMFDFMVPEPASYLWHLESAPGAELALPPPPPKLEMYVASAADVGAWNYLFLAALVNAKGVEPPPPLLKVSFASLKHGESGDEEGQPRSIVEKEIAIPEGYLPWTATVYPVALTDDELTLSITVGTDAQVWEPRGAAVRDLGGLSLARTDLEFFLGAATAFGALLDAQSKLTFQAIAYESNTYTVAGTFTFVRASETLRAWQIRTYETLSSASREQQLKYDQLVADLRARADVEAARNPTTFDAPPSDNLRKIKAELKKHCLSIITRQWYDTANGMNATDPPTFDLVVAASRGSFVRFFEQAFEWDQLQYVCYPYFWANKSRWVDRFRRTEVDPVLQEFLQAGASRVVVPVRPGFEAAVLYFLETLEETGTGVVWNGAGAPPPISSPLYVPIVQEIQERTGAPQGESPVGEPWISVVPTPLVVLRKTDELPSWERQDPQGWEWEEVSGV